MPMKKKLQAALATGVSHPLVAMEVDMRDIAKLIPAMGAMARKVVLVALEAASDSEDKTKPQTNPIENNIGTYAPSENVPIEGEEDADARYRGYGGYGGYRRPYGGYGGSYGGYGGRGYGGYGGYGYRG
ncbi:hypothetical protein QYM36_001109 [Artemia franciscana]|uniref:Uncharacterized protein n=1 Tax=Artemia franciscana TaxID=6661 RepID=A0AA88ID74_ARTSF|nr:hypothetical protein QYM36_001109 [Artemia franciscana]